jgi:hypothetical protein
LAPKNSCTNSKINAFFQEGTLPGRNNFCSLQAGPFGVVLPGGLEKRSDFRKIREKMRNILKM